MIVKSNTIIRAVLQYNEYTLKYPILLNENIVVSINKHLL